MTGAAVSLRRRDRTAAGGASVSDVGVPTVGATARAAGPFATSETIPASAPPPSPPSASASTRTPRVAGGRS
jgi:hypothetical protein